ncbi:hypothetical protein AB1Y20_017563 [Prymnesium parvum]|uniref:RING-type domain-containing protein n=1 Tax=Prymnesium parvum TaxID=97485 RepID=A0AB34JPH1_PRYPA
MPMSLSLSDTASDDAPHCTFHSSTSFLETRSPVVEPTPSALSTPSPRQAGLVTQGASGRLVEWLLWLAEALDEMREADALHWRRVAHATADRLLPALSRAATVVPLVLGGLTHAAASLRPWEGVRGAMAWAWASPPREGAAAAAAVVEVCEARLLAMGAALAAARREEEAARRHAARLDVSVWTREQLVRQLTREAAGLGARARAAEAEAEAARAEARAEARRREEAARAAEEAAAREAEERRARAAACAVCLEEDAGVVACGGCGEAHYVCAACLEAHVGAFTRRPVALRAEGQVPCVGVRCVRADGTPTTYAAAQLAALLPAEAFEEYLRSMRAVLEAAVEAEAEERVRRSVAAELRRREEAARAGRGEVEALLRALVEEVLTLKCPRCGQAYDDFEGCAALQCSRCPCHFCGWCTADCAADAHAHVRTCAEKPPGVDAYFPRPRRVFEEHWQRRKRAGVERLMRGASMAAQRTAYAELKDRLDEVGFAPPHEGGIDEQRQE